MLLTACSDTKHNDYKFSGESEHWEAEYAYKGTEKWGGKKGKETYSNEDISEFRLKYKGSLEELSSLQKLHYSYEANSRREDSNQEFTEPPSTVTFLSSSRSNGAMVREDTVIKVTVIWDGFKESFELHNNSK
ncbi:hypothetical protein AZE41_16635 [Sporosarcina psychrophila]|nr:hypothetical protein AZE41_16635 [Sporosarcina psychrophila]